MPDVFYRRHLPHWLPEATDVLLTWRLAGSLPRPQPDTLTAENTSFRGWNESLDRCETGPTWLSDHRIATVVRDALLYGQNVNQVYGLHAWAIMPNHVHAVLQPKIALSKIMHWIKRATARRANQILGRTGEAFWQDESYDHWIRTDRELDSAIAYVERNPVTGGWWNGRTNGPGRARLAADMKISGR